MKIVTGGAGFIGSHLAHSLHQAGAKVAVLDTFNSTPYRTEIKKRRADSLRKIGISVFEGSDLSEFPLREEIETVFNLGAIAGLTPSWTQQSAYYENNLSSLGRNLEYLVKHHPAAKFIHASTSSVYGTSTSGLGVNHSLNPVSPYGVSKFAAEKLLSAYSSNFGLRQSILRLFSVYGPGQRPDQFFSIALNRIVKGQTITIFGDGSNSRTNCFVSDAAEAFVLAEQHFRSGNILDIAGNESITVLQVVNRLGELLDESPKLEFCDERPGDQTDTRGNIAEAQSQINWKPKTSFFSGTESLTRNFLANPELYV